MSETSQMELELLQRRADACNHFVQRHRNYDPCRGDGDLYLQPKKKFGNERVESLLSYATPDEIHATLGEIESDTLGKLKV